MNRRLPISRSEAFLNLGQFAGFAILSVNSLLPFMPQMLTTGVILAMSVHFFAWMFWPH